MAVDRMRCGPIGRDSIRNNLEIGFVEPRGQTLGIIHAATLTGRMCKSPIPRPH